MDPNVDEHSVMTYLSQFPKAKLKPGAPLRPKLNPKKARAYGPGKGAWAVTFQGVEHLYLAMGTVVSLKLGPKRFRVMAAGQITLEGDEWIRVGQKWCPDKGMHWHSLLRFLKSYWLLGSFLVEGGPSVLLFYN